MLQRPVKPEAYYAHWHSQRPVVAVMGEYSAGKSTLLNYLLGQDIFPTRITATNFPPVWLTYGKTPSALALNADGTVLPFDPADLADFGATTYSVLRLAVPLALLRDIDVLDTPGISDVRLAKRSLIVFSPFLDAVVWCSNVSQAWRQTEVSMWKSFPKALHESSLLVLTQSDKLHDPRDIDKVMKRVTRETRSLFSKRIPVSIHLAQHEYQAADAGGQKGNSNIMEFQRVFSGVIARAKKACKARPDVAAPETQIFDYEKSEEHKKEHLDTLNQKNHSQKECKVSNVDISKLAEIGGFIGACLVDSETGLMMASEGGGKLDLEAAGAANTEVVKAKLSAIQMLGLDDHIDDILITLGKQFHLIRPLEKTPTVFLYVALDKKAANLGMARVQVKSIEKELSI